MGRLFVGPCTQVSHFCYEGKGGEEVLVGLEVADLDLLERHGGGARGGRGTRSTSELTRGVICDGSRRSHSHASS